MVSLTSCKQCKLPIKLWKNRALVLSIRDANRSYQQKTVLRGLQIMAGPADYMEWSSEQLIDRVTSLEKQLREQATRYELSQSNRFESPSPPRKPKNPRVNREFDPSKYSTRLIALKFAYLGQRYNGLEYHSKNPTPLPTIEEELWKALNKARLVFPTPNSVILDGGVNWEGCEFSKCGRTDKGVSAFGQVIGIKVRSNRPLRKPPRHSAASEGSVDEVERQPLESYNVERASEYSIVSAPRESSDDDSPPFDPIKDEIPYVRVLNNLLPSDIRVLAWCANPPATFSARFSCKERRYRYFFSQPAFTPTYGAAGLGLYETNTRQFMRQREGWLDIEAMREGARKFEGLHDFRNFCKVDPSKQMENFERRIFHADIEAVTQGLEYVGLAGFQGHQDSSADGQKLQTAPSSSQTISPKVYVFTLHGSAFLWHQVRHMMAILFLIGQGLEAPSLVAEMLDVRKTPQKPMYEMASDAPLVLWDCIFPREGGDPRQDALEWLYVGDPVDSSDSHASAAAGKNDGKFGRGGVVDEMWKVWRERKIDEVLAGSLLDIIARQGTQSVTIAESRPDDASNREKPREVGGSQRVFQGGNSARLVGRYVPVLQRSRTESVEAINARYAKRKGFELDGEARESGFRRFEPRAGSVG